MKVIAAESVQCHLLVCDNDQVYVGMVGDMGYRQYYTLEPISSDLVWLDGEQLELDLALNNYIAGEL
tara:strand:- start:1110 stop:1310 length:201 start_codon:yes stop_codon:yes gene_type:complete